MSPRKSLAAALLFFGIGSSYRAVHFWVTGFYVPDEFGYVTNAWRDNIGYQGRYFFNGFNRILFGLLRIDSVDKLVMVMPFYFMTWICVGLFSAYKTLRLLELSNRAISATMLFLLTIPLFSLLSLSLLTEPVVFGTSMLGIYLTVKFFKSGETNSSLAYPLLSALCFAAAAYTRQDFLLFQVGGIVPFLFAGLMKSRGGTTARNDWKRITASVLLYAIPAVFFLFYPERLGQGGFETVASTGQSNPSIIRTAELFLLGIVGGYTPITGTIALLSFFFLFYLFLKRKAEHFLPLWLAFLGLGAFGGVSFLYSTASLTAVPLSTILRYSYDSIPGYVVAAPFLFARIRSRKVYAAIGVGLIVFGGVAATSYQDYLQSNLSAHYPFLSGNDNFLSLSYRVPYAQMRDYFFTLPPSERIAVMADTDLGDPCTLAYCFHALYNFPVRWAFTPGIGKLAGIQTFTYVNASTLANKRVTTFYLYIEKGASTDRSYFNQTNYYILQIANGTLNSQNEKLPFEVTSLQVIYDRPSFFLAKVSLQYNK